MGTVAAGVLPVSRAEGACWCLDDRMDGWLFPLLSRELVTFSFGSRSFSSKVNTSSACHALTWEEANSGRGAVQRLEEAPSSRRASLTSDCLKEHGQ